MRERRVVGALQPHYLLVQVDMWVKLEVRGVRVEILDEVGQGWVIWRRQAVAASELLLVVVLVIMLAKMRPGREPALYAASTYRKSEKQVSCLLLTSSAFS